MHGTINIEGKYSFQPKNSQWLPVFVLVMVGNEAKLLWGTLNIMFVEFLSAGSKVFIG